MIRARIQAAQRTSDWPTHGLCTEAVPARSVVQIASDVSGRPVVNVQQAAYAGYACAAAVAPYGLTANSPGPIIVTGTAPAQVTLKDGETLSVGDRVGVRRADWTLQKDSGGAFRVETIEATTGAVKTCRVRFLRRRLDHVPVIDNGAAVPVTASGVIFGRGYSSVQASFGKTAVSDA